MKDPRYCEECMASPCLQEGEGDPPRMHTPYREGDEDPPFDFMGHHQHLLARTGELKAQESMLLSVAEVKERDFAKEAEDEADRIRFEAEMHANQRDMVHNFKLPRLEMGAYTKDPETFTVDGKKLPRMTDEEMYEEMLDTLVGRYDDEGVANERLYIEIKIRLKGVERAKPKDL